MKRTISISIMVVGVILATGFANNAVWAGLVTGDPSLPPTEGEYRSPSEYGPEFFGPDIQIVVQDIVYQALAIPSPVRTNVGADEAEAFESTLTAMVNITLFGVPQALVPLTLSGPSEWMAYGKVGNVTGMFTVEIVSMELSGEVIVPILGPVPIILRESPTLPSMGETTITDIGGGLYHIDSFFDVFAEVSPAGGPFIPATDSVHIELVPEPATLGVLVLGGAVLTLSSRFRYQHSVARRKTI